MARTVSAGLDTRAAKLEALLDEADKRIETLRDERVERARSFGRAARGGCAAGPCSRLSRCHHPPTIDMRRFTICMIKVEAFTRSPPALGRPSGEIELILALPPRGGVEIVGYFDPTTCVAATCPGG